VEDVFKRTRMDVLRGSNSKQAPWYSSTLEEEFISPRLPGDPRRRRREPTPRRPRPSLRFRPPAPTKAGIDARRQNRNPGAPATAPKPVTPANPDAARDESIRQLDARIRANPNDVAAIYTRGQIYAKNRNFSMRRTGTFPAPSKTSMRWSGSTRNAEALNNRCWARRHRRRSFRRTEGLQRGACGFRARYADAYDSRGLVHLKRGSFKDAVIDYDTALGINPNHYGRGLAKRRNGDSAGGDRDIDAAKDIQSDIVDEFFWYAVR
jgi:tetratricopeptide (TPR) repeat protein